MQPRLDYTKASPGTVRALFGLEVYLHGCGLEHGLLHLVKLRASQVNGCAYCIDMHSKDARAAGETEQRLYLLDAWREAPFYTDREREFRGMLCARFSVEAWILRDLGPILSMPPRKLGRVATVFRLRNLENRGPIFAITGSEAQGASPTGRPARYPRMAARSASGRFITAFSDDTTIRRSAFAWTEAVTKVTEGHVPDAVFEEVREQFNDKELADLTMAIAAINAWNRMAISFRALPGGYQPGQFNHLLERQAH